MIMDNQGNNTHTFINNTSFSHENSLTHLLDTDEPEDEVESIKLSEYMILIIYLNLYEALRAVLAY